MASKPSSTSYFSAVPDKPGYVQCQVGGCSVRYRWQKGEGTGTLSRHLQSHPSLYEEFQQALQQYNTGRSKEAAAAASSSVASAVAGVKRGGSSIASERSNKLTRTLTQSSVTSLFAGAADNANKLARAAAQFFAENNIAFLGEATAATPLTTHSSSSAKRTSSTSSQQTIRSSSSSRSC